MGHPDKHTPKFQNEVDLFAIPPAWAVKYATTEEEDSTATPFHDKLVCVNDIHLCPLERKQSFIKLVLR